jgi:hypothetical protein
MAAVVVPFKIRRRSLSAEVAVDALIVDVKLPFDIFGVFVRDISHSFFLNLGIRTLLRNAKGATEFPVASNHATYHERLTLDNVVCHAKRR